MEPILNFLKDYPYVPAVAIAALGWWWIHRLNSARDRVNSERTMRTTELAKVYSIILRTGIYGAVNTIDDSGKTVWINEELEDAVGKIYLYGTKQQVQLVDKYVDSWSNTQGADGTELINSLRNHIRESLGLESIPGNLKYLVIKVKREKREA